MKPCIVLLFALPVCLGVTAQQKPLSLDAKPLKPGRLYMPSPKTGLVTVIPTQDSLKARFYQQEADRRWKQGGVSGTYSHITARGKVYTLTPDNMPCLVPDRKTVAPMPNKRQLFVEDRNGGVPVVPIIPQADKTTDQ